MKARPRPWRVALGVAAAVVVTAVLAALPSAQSVSVGFDLLELPAPQTTRGERRLLLDVAQAGSRLVAVGEFGLILYSDDAGRHWKQSSSPTSVMLTALSFADANRGWAVGHDGAILATQDAGLHWQRQFDGGQANSQVLHAVQAQFDQVPAAIKPTDTNGQRLREQAEDRLADAESAVKAGPSRPFLGVRFIDTNTGFVVGAFGQLFQTEDAGKQWRYIGDRLANSEGLHLNNISAAPNGDLYIAAESGTVFRSGDRGKTWSRSQVNYNGQLFGVLSTGNYAHAVQIAYGFGGHMFRSADSGAHWQVLDSPFKQTVVSALALGDGRFVMASQDGQWAVGHDADERLALLPVQAKLRKTSGFALLTPTTANSASTVIAVGLGGISVAPMDLGAVQP